MLIGTTIRNTVVKAGSFPIRAFTLLESLLTLGITLFLLTLLSTGIGEVYHAFERNLFYIRFEHFYTESQTLAWARQEPAQLSFQEGWIRGPEGEMELPEGLELVSNFQLDLNPKGNHTGLSRIVFRDQVSGKTIHYQARIGNGILQRTEE